jgi:cytochrome o ubiquinol oxidase subunit 2
MLVPLAACSEGALAPAGPVAADERVILFNALAIMLAIIVPTILAALAFAWWFRAGNTRARYRPDFAYSGRIELLVWSIPLLTITFLGGVIWIGSHRLDPYRPLPTKPGQRAIEVQVVSLDWKWLFIYPEQGVASVNRLVIPAGVPVHFTLTGASVMNTFYVPRLGGMIYTMNGMDSQIHLQADKPGSYLGRSAMFSGDGFSGMKFTVDAVPANAFGGWIARTKAAGPALTIANYRRLARQSMDVPPFTFSAVDQRIFPAVTKQLIQPAAGPTNVEGGSNKSPGGES